MEIRIAGIEKESITDGTGIRYTIFTQGCLHNCLGCHNKDTHDFNAGRSITIEEILTDLRENPLLDGITLSGGDPFFQCSACIKLIKAVKKEFEHFNIWAYTGFKYEEILKVKEMTKMLHLIDVLVDGRFELNNRTLESKFIGSTNQRLIDVQKSLENNKVIEKKLWNNKHIGGI